ncbi:MAG: response regulator [Actinobacteria bacterium]|nr:response regulator [Actinomycetota bacterium]MBV8562483.1 response regulator [Actinomycetota bacterium]
MRTEPLRVLIAEDETIIRLDLRGLLERQGLRVCGEARNGKEAVELARELEPDVAILDLRMPELDGVEAARRIYGERPLPIVMLTAYADRHSIERALEAGVFTYLVKPFRESDVGPAVRAAYARHEELLAARRQVGEQPLRPLVIGLRSSSGDRWPTLRIGRDGVTVVEEAD